jgi:NAD(P)-dependent dehydrogenase (short-subunit alcohol dehydrogenase family)
MNMFDLSGKVAVVTGATRGIGRGIAECLAAARATVVVASRSQQDCKRVAAEIVDLHPHSSSFGASCNVADTDSISALVEQVVRRAGGIDVLVCNAARMPQLVPFGEAPDEEFLAQFDTNVVKTLRFCMLVAPSMKSRGGGSIVLIGSRTGIAPAPQQLAYSCGKAAETHLARNLAAHLAPDNIRVNCIAPGLIRSDASKVIFDNPTALAAFTRDIPLRRGASPGTESPTFDATRPTR